MCPVQKAKKPCPLQRQSIHYYFQVSLLKHAQSSPQTENDEKATDGILNRTGACAIVHYHTFSVCQIVSQYNSRCALSLRRLHGKQSLVRWFLPLLCKEAAVMLAEDHQLLTFSAKPEQTTAKMHNEKKYKIPGVEVQTSGIFAIFRK